MKLFQSLWKWIKLKIKKTPKLLPTVGIVLLALSLYTSRNILSNRPNAPKDWWELLSSTGLYLFSSLATFWVFFLVLLTMAVIYNLLRPGHITEFGAKFLGFEISYKRQITEAVQELREYAVQIDTITDLNENMLEYIAKAFEEDILKTKDQAATIRQKVHELLLDVYFEQKEVKVFVQPLTDDGINSLGDKLAALIRGQIKPEQDVTTTMHNTVGIGIHYGTEGLDTVIVIDTTSEGRKISPAEITAASALFVAVATAIDWATKSRG